MQTTYTRAQLEKGVPEDDAIGQSVKRSYYRDRCGDVALVMKPYYLLTGYTTGTSHGTPHEYDTHVPLLVYGTGRPPGRRRDAVTPEAAAAILAHGLGVNPPVDAEAPVPDNLFGK